MADMAESRRFVIVLTGYNQCDNEHFSFSRASGSVHVMAEIDAKIKAQGDKIRYLKAAKSSKDVIDPEVKTLLGLKAEFKVQLIFLETSAGFIIKFYLEMN